jgi:hypothetical protein
VVNIILMLMIFRSYSLADSRSKLTDLVSSTAFGAAEEGAAAKGVPDVDTTPAFSKLLNKSAMLVADGLADGAPTGSDGNVLAMVSCDGERKVSELGVCAGSVCE